MAQHAMPKVSGHSADFLLQEKIQKSRVLRRDESEDVIMVG